MKENLLVLVVCVFFSLGLKAETADTIDITDDGITVNFENNLDSMLNLYYVQQALSIAETDSMYLLEADSSLPDYPDSVYIDRLKKLPFIMPMTYNRVVKSYIDVYAKKKPDKVRVMLSLSNYYFPIFEEIFSQYGLPDELKYLSIIESALNPRAVSRAGATGLWQFMLYTGKRYGLTVNTLVDERKNPIKSTYAAASFLKDLYDIYHDWTLVIAAYNCGPGNVNKAIRRSGGKTNYWDIYYYLPRETRGYVPAFIAASYIFNYPREHNLTPAPVVFEFHTDTMMISDKLHLQQVAKVLDIPVEILRDLNPQYKYDIIPGDNKSLSLCIPQVKTMKFIEMQDSIFAYNDSVFFNNDNIIITPTAKASQYSPVLPSDKYTLLYYHVKSGDNLGYISTWYNVRVSDIRYWNNIRANTIRKGQRLKIYVPKGKAERYAGIDDMTLAEKQRGTGTAVRQTSNETASSQPKASLQGSEDYELYKVRSGDTLWDIAKKFPGVSDDDLIRLNNLRNGNSIKPGQVIKVRRKS